MHARAKSDVAARFSRVSRNLNISDVEAYLRTAIIVEDFRSQVQNSSFKFSLPSGPSSRATAASVGGME